MRQSAVRSVLCICASFVQAVQHSLRLNSAGQHERLCHVHIGRLANQHAMVDNMAESVDHLSTSQKGVKMSF